MRAEPRPSLAQLREMTGCVCLALRRTSRTVTQYYDAALRSHRLRATQFPILVAGSLQEDVPLADLAKILGMDRTTLLRNARPLARRKLLEVVTAKDSRKSQIRVTEAGRTLLSRIYPDWKRAQTEVLRGLEGSAWSLGLNRLEAAARRPKN